jgi:arsenate reductase
MARILTDIDDLVIIAATGDRSRSIPRRRMPQALDPEGTLGKEQPEVLFVCVHNAGRSQMAAGLVKLRSRGRIHVRSAGSTPAAEINPAAIEAMEELGIDMSDEFPKPLTDEVVRAADVVITMGCGDACPIYPGKRYEDWELDDPEGKDLETVRRIRDEIDRRVQHLIGELIRESTHPTG